MPISSGHGLMPTAVNAAMRGKAFGAKTAPTMPLETDLAVRQALAGVARQTTDPTRCSVLPKNEWQPLFRKAFNDPGGPVEKLITTNKISVAIAAYERTMTFTNTPWKAYVQGNNGAISESAKRGARRSSTSRSLKGAPTAVRATRATSSPTSRYWVIAVPQIGRGKTDINNRKDAIDDWGRAHVTGKRDDKYAYRTQTLLGVEMTGPYGPQWRLQHAEDSRPPPSQRREVDSRVRLREDPVDGGPLQLNFSKEHTEHALREAQAQRKDGKTGVLADVDAERRAGGRPGGVPENADRPLPQGSGVPGEVDPGPDRSGSGRPAALCAKDRDGKELWAPSCATRR